MMATRRNASEVAGEGQHVPAAGGRIPVSGSSVVAGALLVLAVALSIFHVLTPTGEEFGLEMALPLAAFGIAFAAVGGFVAARRPAHPVGWLVLGIGVAQSLSGFATSYAWRAVIAEPGSLPGGMVMAWASTWLFTPVVGLLVLLLLLFPTGRLPSPRWRVVPAVLLVALGVEMVTPAIMPGEIDGLVGIANPVGLDRLGGILPVIHGAAKGTGVVMTIVAVASLVARFRGAQGDERAGLLWILYVSAFLVLFALANMAMDFAGVPLNVFAGYGLLVSFIALPVTIGAVILRYRLYDIDLIINRTLVYATLSTLVAAIYLAVIAALGAILDDPDRPGLSVALMVAVTIGVVPLRDRLQRAVNRLMYGDREDPYAVLERLGTQLETGAGPEHRFQRVATTLRQALRVPWVEITRQDAAEPLIAAAGRRSTAPLSLPLQADGVHVGEMVVGHRVGETAFSASDMRLLHELARQLGSALHAQALSEATRRLSVDLQHSRERLVVAREEERRRLRRDLHDGLGPQLASITMKAEAAREMATTPGQASGLLEDIATEARDAVADVRRLVDGLRPPALDELGLVGALQSQATRLGGEGLSIDVVASGDLRALPAAVEVVAYRIAAEAMANIRRHAAASRGTVHLTWGEGALLLRIEDDGAGIRAGQTPGVGLHSMRERAEELGGSLMVERRVPSGTVVIARLPIAAGREDGE